MLLFELLGIDAPPGDPTHNLQKKAGWGTIPVGRPQKKIRKRPNKNLWFQDAKTWGTDVHLTHGGEYELVSSEDEENLIACDRDHKHAFGWWNKQTGRGITFKKPRPIQTVVHPSTPLKTIWKG